MEFRKAAKIVFELQTEKLIESSEDHKNVRRARRMFGGPDEGKVNILNLRVRLRAEESNWLFSQMKKYHVGLCRMIRRKLICSWTGPRCTVTVWLVWTWINGKGPLACSGPRWNNFVTFLHIRDYCNHYNTCYHVWLVRWVSCLGTNFCWCNPTFLKFLFKYSTL